MIPKVSDNSVSSRAVSPLLRLCALAIKDVISRGEDVPRCAAWLLTLLPRICDDRFVARGYVSQGIVPNFSEDHLIEMRAFHQAPPVGYR